MEIRVPDYYDAFHCLAGDCPHTCCAAWEVVIDEETARRYEREPGPLGERLRAALVRDEEGDLCFALDGGSCPFLDGEGLCQIHRQLGEAATSVTCREHPRFTEEYGPFREITLAASCPAANRLLLGTSAPLKFRTVETAEEGEPWDPWVPHLLVLRQRLLELLGDRRWPLRRRMGAFLRLAAEAQDALDQDRAEELDLLAGSWQPPEEPAAAAAGEELTAALLALLGTLEVLEEDWPGLLAAAAAAPETPGEEALLERIGTYAAFRYLLKAVNDGGILERAQLCVALVLAAEQISAVCGLPEALRRLSCEVEHDADNLEALLEAFRWEEAFSLSRFLAALEGGRAV